MLSAELRKWKEKASICYLQASVNENKHPCVVFRHNSMERKKYLCVVFRFT
jgi:hypothetical protein